MMSSLLFGGIDGYYSGFLWCFVPSKWLDYDLSTRLMQLMS